MIRARNGHDDSAGKQQGAQQRGVACALACDEHKHASQQEGEGDGALSRPSAHQSASAKVVEHATKGQQRRDQRAFFFVLKLES